MTHSPMHVGIDVSKAWLDVATWPTGTAFRVANTAVGWAELVARLSTLPIAAIGLEASGGYERGVLRHLLDAGLSARRINPFQLRQFAKACGIRAKNDRLDAAMIARFLAQMPSREVLRHPAAEALAALVLARRQLTEEHVRLQNQSAQVEDAFLRRFHRQRLARLKADILRLDRRLAEQVAANPDFAHRQRLLRSAPGVGPVLAHTLLALMPELGSLSGPEAAALAGVAPYDWDSGTYAGQRHIWGGRAPVRCALYMACLAAARHNPRLKPCYDRLIAKGKPAKVALVAIMRKLITMLNAMLRDKLEWIPNLS
jgi:transposase